MGMGVNKMDKQKDIITIDVLHKAMQRSNTDAIRINKALGLDTCIWKAIESLRKTLLVR
jgi:hypothetical protein